MIDLTTLGRVTSGFGLRAEPTAGASTNHKGIDIVLNDPNIPAVLGGTVSYVGYSSSGGNMITIEQNDGTTATYMHMKEPSNLKVGQTVTEGQTVGIMGSTGVSTGDHVHYQVKDGEGNFLNPAGYFNDGTKEGLLSGLTGDGLKDTALSLVGNIITVLAVILVCVLAVYLFMKAFNIDVLKGVI